MTWSIIWSYLKMILSCTWVAVHTNIPDPDKKWIKVASCCMAVRGQATSEPSQ